MAINRFPSDTPAELDIVRQYCAKIGVECSLSEVVAKGSEGGLDLAKKILNKVKEIKMIEFDHKDVVRHPLVTKIIQAGNYIFEPLLFFFS